MNTDTIYTDYSDYADFLKDKKFIQWQLMPDEALKAYWQEFIRQHPHLTPELHRAEAYLKKAGLNKKMLSDEDRIWLLSRIQQTIEQKNKRTKIRHFIRYTAAACAAIAFIMIGLHFFMEKTSYDEPGRELILGNLLNSEDIQLVTGEKTISYQNDINVQINEQGTAKIIQSDGEETIDIIDNTLNKLIVPYGKRSKIELPDGSQVWLNSGSVMEFPSAFSNRSRDIYVSGEIYIEVAPDKKKSFCVHTSDFNVKVYGTAFNVSAYEQASSSIVLVKGSVALQPSGKKEETSLRPNEMAVYNSQSATFDTQGVDVNSYIRWKEGYLVFDKTPMPEVLKRIERYYNLSFNYDNDVSLQKRTCTGKIYLSDNLDNVMTTIGLLSSTIYTRTENQIFITNEPN